MSVYCTHWSLDDRGCPDFDRPLPSGGTPPQQNYVEYVDGRRFAMKSEPCRGCANCDGLGSPIVYEASHIMPSLDSPRRGYVEFASPASHIPTVQERSTGRTYVEEREGGKPGHPWLRLSVNDGCVVLTEPQVRSFHAALGEWLEREKLGLDA